MSKKQDTNGTQMQSGSETAVSLNSDQSPIDKDNGTSGCAGCGCADCNESKPTGEFVNLVKEFTPDKSHVALTAATQAPSAAPGSPVPPQNAQPGGWIPTPPQQGVDVDTARQRIESRPLPTNIYVPASSQVPSGAVGLAAGFAGNTVAGPASIVELARSLKSNVDLIYEWIFNNIEMLPSYGSQKGGLGAVIDGYGNSFDQADLMVQLLRQAGYTSNYQFGTLRMTAAQAGAWLGTDPTNIWAANNYLANSGVPVSVVNISGVDGIEFSHCWVLCNIGGTNYVFDPSQKTYTTKTKINLATAMSYNASTFMTRAKSGATVTADYVKDMNRANIRSDLATMTANLVSWIKTNNHAAAMDDILGGRNIVQNDAATPLRQANHPFKKSGSTVTTWTSIPQAYKATMHIVYDTIDMTFNSHDLAGKRLTLTFNGSNQGELRLDGTLLATSSAQGVGTWNSVLFDIVHPYASWFADQYVWQRVWAGKPYLLCNSWGNLAASATAVHGKRIKTLEASFASRSAEPMVGETMAQMWKTMDFELSNMADIINRLSNCSSVMHHQCGLIGWFDTAFADIGAITWGTSALDNNYNQQQANDTTLAQHGVALEAQIVREFQEVSGAAATSVVDTAVAAGQKIYDGKTANWLTNVKPNLINYSAGDKTNIENWYINNGYRVGLPENGAITIGSWTGHGYFAIPSYGTYGIISGALKGVTSTMLFNLPALTYMWTEQNWNVFITNTFPPPDCATLTVAYNASICGPWNGQCICWIPAASYGYSGDWKSAGMPLAASGTAGYGVSSPGSYASSEPIDLASGAYLLDATDLTIGSAGFPYGLGFSRTYNSDAKDQHGPIGRGWRHNLQIYAGRDTLGYAGMGGQTVIGAAATIVEAFVTYDLQTDLTKPFDKYITCALANQWFVDNLSDNIVTIQEGFNSRTFVKLPNGTYASPGADGGTLTVVSGNYVYTSLTGVKYNFNALGHISTIVFPAGVTVTFAYDSYAKLTSVTNGLGRILTLTYQSSGNANMLASVSDGTGRSVAFTIDPATANLTSVTDPNSKSTTYQYDIPGRMIKFFRPAFPTTAVATNTFDTLNRVKEQRDANNNLWQYYFAGSRSEEVDPNGKKSILYYNGAGQAVKAINQLGKISTAVFDGRGRQIKATAPEGNSVETVFNALNLPTQVTAKAKPGSGLANIVTSFTYDATWNKVKTAVDGLSRTTTYNYDPANGNLLSVVTPNVTGVGASTVTMTYNARGQVLTVSDPLSMVTKNTYDVSTEKLLSVVQDFGVGRLNLTANFGYDSVGNLTTLQDPRGNTVTTQFDVLRRATQVTAPAPFSYVTKFTFDDNGNRTKVERQTGDIVTPWQTSTATFSAENLLLTVVGPGSHTTTYGYDNMHRVQTITDAASRVVTKVYDDVGRIYTVKDPSNTICQTYTYSDNGKVLSLQDARSNSTQFTFDGFDRPSKTIYSDGTFEHLTGYDANSNPATLLLRKDHPTAPIKRYKIDFTYDELNRVKTKVVTDDATSWTVTNTYNLAGQSTNVNLSGSAFGTGNYQKFFDTAGRFFKEQYPDSKAVTHVLDANGNVTRTTYPDGSYYVDRVYDQLNRLTDIKLNGAATSAIQFQYDQLSRRKKILYENGTTTDYGLTYDDNLTSLVQTFVGSNVTFTYGFDNVHQMNSQAVSDNQFMWHPAAAGTSTYASANNLNQYGTVGGVAQSYDASGCLTNDGSFSYIFNAENMLTQVKNAAGSTTIASYLYDPMMRQVQKLVGAVKTNFYYSGFERLADYDGTAGTLQNRYVYGVGMDEILIQVASGGTKTYYHANNQGSVVATTSAAGAVLNRYKYGPFGESAPLTGTTHGYSGQKYDAETGLYYYKMRHYSPKIGRFLQSDPVGLNAGLNLYTYCANSPLTATDSLGLFSGPPGISESDAIHFYLNLQQLKNKYGDVEMGRAGRREGSGWRMLNLDRQIDFFFNGVRPPDPSENYTDVLMTHPLASKKHGWVDTADSILHLRNDFREPYEYTHKPENEGKPYRLWTLNKDEHLYAYDGATNTIWEWKLVGSHLVLQNTKPDAYKPFKLPSIKQWWDVLTGHGPGLDYYDHYEDGILVGSFTKQVFSGITIGNPGFTSYGTGSSGSESSGGSK